MALQFVEKLSRSQISDVQRQTHDLWGEHWTLEQRLERLTYSMSFAGGPPLSMCGFVDENNDVVASMKRYALDLTYQNQTLTALGMGAIFTPQQYRKNGLAHDLISRVITDARDRDCPLVFLFSDIGPTYYQRFGFFELPALDMHVEITAISSISTDYQLIKAENGDRKKLIAFHENIFSIDVLRSKHNPPSWAFVRDRFGVVDDFLISNGDDDIGFVSLSIHNNSLMLHEFFVPADKEMILFSLLKDLAATHHVQKISGSKTWQELAWLPKVIEKRAKALPMLLILDEKLPKNIATWFSSLDHF